MLIWDANNFNQFTAVVLGGTSIKQAERNIIGTVLRVFSLGSCSMACKWRVYKWNNPCKWIGIILYSFVLWDLSITSILSGEKKELHKGETVMKEKTGDCKLNCKLYLFNRFKLRFLAKTEIRKGWMMWNLHLFPEIKQGLFLQHRVVKGQKRLGDKFRACKWSMMTVWRECFQGKLNI